MVCSNKLYHFKSLQGSLPQLLFSPFLNNLTHLEKTSDSLWFSDIFRRIRKIALAWIGLMTPKKWSGTSNYVETMFERTNNIWFKVFKNRSSKICSLWKIWSDMVRLSRLYHFIYFKGCLPQILLDPFLIHCLT